jgi:hypothetical protein
MKPADGFAQHAYQISMPAEFPARATALVLENNRALPLPDKSAVEIGEKGMGRYSVWQPGRTIYFSASDNTDPRKNGRTYELYWTPNYQDVIEYPGPNFQIVAVKKK